LNTDYVQNFIRIKEYFIKLCQNIIIEAQTVKSSHYCCYGNCAAGSKEIF